MKKSLLSLAFGTFALGIVEFGMMGILSDIANDLNISIIKAGHLISAYSAGVAVGAPSLLFLRKFPLRRLMLLLAAIIAVGNALVALSPNYVCLLSARFIAGLPHGAFFGAGAIVCSKLADNGKGASAVAVLVGGMTIANLIGVPGFTFMCHILSWRLPFGMVALFGLITFIAIKYWVPILSPLPDSGMKGQFRFLSKPAPWLIYAGVFFEQASVYCWLSYISPIMTKVAGFSESSMTFIMVLVGAGMVFGNFYAGRLSDKYTPSIVTAIIATLTIVLMPMMYMFASYKIPSLLFAFIAPGLLFGLGGPLQYLIVRYAKGGEMLGGAGIQIAFNVSNAVAAILGGAVIKHGFGLASPALAGIPCAIVGAIALYTLYYHEKRM
ncbi:MFS transporter [Butyricimonas synergistica]|uniref:MFS transporter n=1 Tax=Butyricimonas synergistica TaxID=544644 RepID=UPI00037FC321|nr:MFS transporter [Butyricimonas synergistica]